MQTKHIVKVSAGINIGIGHISWDYTREWESILVEMPEPIKLLPLDPKPEASSRLYKLPLIDEELEPIVRKRRCLAPACRRQSDFKGFCSLHAYLINRKCKSEGCSSLAEDQRDYCWMHGLFQTVYNGFSERGTCRAADCHEVADYGNKYCSVHDYMNFKNCSVFQCEAKVNIEGEYCDYHALDQPGGLLQLRLKK
jgi:hypothetical protein